MSRVSWGVKVVCGLAKFSRRSAFGLLECEQAFRYQLPETFLWPLQWDALLIVRPLLYLLHG